MKYYYQDSAVTIYHGDCREILPQLELPTIKLMIADPPYGQNYKSNYGASWSGTVIEGDSSTLLRDEIINFWHHPAYVFGTWKVERPNNIRQILIWDKGPAFGMGDLSFPWKNSFEEIYVIGHLCVSWESQGRFHPNQKPLSLMTYLMNKHPAPLILDPFMGSGTTLRAAKDLGRKAIGIEIEEKYCEIAARRMGQEVLDFK